MSTSAGVYINLEFTPNPNTLKYSVNRTLLQAGARNFITRTQAEADSPLAARLFEIPGISGVMIGRDFVTVTKTEEGDWDVVHKNTSTVLEQHLTENLPVVTGESTLSSASGHKGAARRSSSRSARSSTTKSVRPWPWTAVTSLSKSSRTVSCTSTCRDLVQDAQAQPPRSRWGSKSVSKKPCPKFAKSSRFDADAPA